jgi:hypothetical protein
LIGHFFFNLPDSPTYISAVLTSFIKVAAKGTWPPTRLYCVTAQKVIILRKKKNVSVWDQQIVHEVRLDQETEEVWRLEEELDKNAVCRQLY